MIKPCLSILLASLMCHFLSAQKLSYTDSSSNYTFTVKLDTSWNKDRTDYDWMHIQSIEVFNKTNGKLLQKIIPQETFLMGNIEPDLFRIEDVNFDGLKDFRVLSDCPFHYQNWHYLFYVMDPATQLFVKDTLLSEMYLGNPSFDPATKTIHSYETDGSADYSSSDYHYEKGIISIVEQNHTSINDNSRIETKYQMVKGKFTEVERIELTAIEGKPGWEL